jgi:hypothetical protein
MRYNSKEGFTGSSFDWLVLSGRAHRPTEQLMCQLAKRVQQTDDGALMTYRRKGREVREFILTVSRAASFPSVDPERF